jgi:hypothetical protein
MNLHIRMLEKVWTADGEMLGLAQRLFHRQSGVNAMLLQYESYLEIGNYELGTAYFVPMDYIEDRDPLTGELALSVSFKNVQERTWSRMPTFVARGEGTEEPLPTR